MRDIRVLDTGWQFGKSRDAASEPICLPHTWNAVDGQDGGNDYYRGTCWYVRTLFPEELTGACIFLEILGANHSCAVYLDGVQLGSHEGGYATFRVDLTQALSDRDSAHRLEISVDNADSDHVYPQKADFTFYGGLYRPVRLISVPESHFELLKDGTPGIKITPVVDLETKSATVTVETWQNADFVQISVGEQSMRVPSLDGHAQAVFQIAPVHLWDGLDDPYLYTASAKLDSGDVVTARFGCRVFGFDAQKGFFLNGRSYPLRGVSRHQDRKDKGNALSCADHEADMAIIRELGANTLRLAHYQHDQAFYDLCDENGLVVWAEIPYITMHMPKGRENTLSQMRELITQCYNHPSIAVWGLSNEISAASAVNESLLENHRALNELCHRLDPTRPTTMANVFMLETDSPLLDIPDVQSYNLYFGWYLGELGENEAFFDDFHAKYPQRVIGFSEYGADANPAFHSAKPERGDYTEEYQALYHEHMLAMIQDRPWLWATHVWNLFDFAADGRDEGGKHGENQKGLVTIDRQIKKDAFYLYKAAWNHKDPFVHICSSRYIHRCEAETEVKVYSNQSQIQLYLDDQLFATQQGERIFRFRVPLTATHTIRAEAGDAVDTICISRVDTPDPAYIFHAAAVTNWFDTPDADPHYYSIQDTLATLRADPQAGAIIDEMLAKSASSRGDVADSVKDNPALQRMLGRMTVASLLKQAGADEQSVQQLQRILQRIPKRD